MTSTDIQALLERLEKKAPQWADKIRDHINPQSDKIDLHSLYADMDFLAPEDDPIQDCEVFNYYDPFDADHDYMNLNESYSCILGEIHNWTGEYSKRWEVVGKDLATACWKCDHDKFMSALEKIVNNFT